MLDVLEKEDTKGKDENAWKNHESKSDKESKWVILNSCNQIHSKDRSNACSKANGQVHGFHVQIETDDSIANFILKNPGPSIDLYKKQKIWGANFLLIN